MANTKPSALQVTYTPSGVGAVVSNVQSKLRESISVKDFVGVDLTGVADSTVGFQNAVNFANTVGADLILPPGNIRLTAPITIAKGLRIVGSHPIAKGPGGADVFLGSWLYFDHGGRGISAVNSLGAGTTGLCLESVGTRRNQPAPAPGWTPNDHDFDVYTFGFLDVTLRDCLLLNPTRGVAMFGNPTDTTGRLNVYDLKMQAFKVGIQVDVAYDVCRIDQLHIWPFWRDDMHVHTYCMNNLDAIWMLRNDNPMLSNLFTIFARSGIRFSQSVLGKTSKVHMTNADFDRGVYGVWIDSSCTDGVTGQFVNVTTQGETGVAGSKGVFVQGDNSVLAFVNFESAFAHHNAVRVDGAGNHVTFSGQLRATHYNQAGVGYPAIEAASGNTVQVDTYLHATALAGPRYGGGGQVIANEWFTYTPSVTAESGALGGYTLHTAVFKRTADTIAVVLDISITAVGTAAGAVLVSLPFASPYFYTGSGREVATGGVALAATVTPAASTVAIRKYDNTFPAIAGSRLTVALSYPL